MQNNFQIVIVEAGTGGIMTAAQLLSKDKKLKIAIYNTWIKDLNATD